VTPVEVAQTPRHFTTSLDALDPWQTGIAGSLTLVAGFGTVLETRRIANRQIEASRKEADEVIAATRAQTEATFKQTEMTIRLERERNESEARAFRALLEAAMSRVLAETAWARRTYPQDSKTGAFVFDHGMLCLGGLFAFRPAASLYSGSSSATASRARRSFAGGLQAEGVQILSAGHFEDAATERASLRLPRGSSAVSGRVALTASTTATAKLRCYVRARRTGRKGETAMVRSRVLLSAIFATLGVAFAGCAAPLSRGYYAGGYPYGIHGYYCGEWSVWPGVSCVHVGPPERVYPPPADP
jgi:hypothetical protein